MTRLSPLLSLFAMFLLFAGCGPSSKPLHLEVNPWIGTGGHGHTYPGATSPFGMVQLSPDTRLEGWDGCGGYHDTDSVVPDDVKAAVEEVLAGLADGSIDTGCPACLDN